VPTGTENDQEPKSRNVSRSNDHNRAHDQLTDHTSWLETPWLLIKGFLMGTADIIPGVSGGTMALITGIYDRLIHAVRSLDLQAILALFRLKPGVALQRLHWKFLLLLLLGIGLAVVFFTRVVPLQHYMHSHPELIFGLFFGLILGSIFVLIREIEQEKRSLSILLPLLIGTIIGYQVVILVPAATPDNPLFMFLSGMIAFCAMILPGISGSYLLVILGKYDYVLARLSELGGDTTLQAALSLAPLFLGGALGLALFSRIISWLLRHYHTWTISLLTGFLLGSLILIWPFQDRVYEEEVIHTEVLPPTDAEVQHLLENPPDNTRLQYRRIAPESVDQAKPGAHVQIEVVERRLAQSTPYLPGSHDRPFQEENMLQGIGGMLFGLLLVGGLDILRKKGPGT